MTDSTGFPRIPRSSLLSGRAQASVTRVTSQSSVSAHATCGDTPTPISHAWTPQPVNRCRDTPTPPPTPRHTRHALLSIITEHTHTHQSWTDTPICYICSDTPTHQSSQRHAHITRRCPQALTHTVIPEALPPLPRYCPLTISPGPASRRTRMRGMGGNRRASTDFLQGRQREPNKSA